MLFLFLILVIVILVVLLVHPSNRKDLKDNFEETLNYIGETAAKSIEVYNNIRGDLKKTNELKKVSIIEYKVENDFPSRVKISEINEDEDDQRPSTKSLKDRYRKKFLRDPTKGKAYANEELCRSVFENVYDVPFPRSRPDFLSNPLNNFKTNLELDGYNECLGIAFEYNGEHHYNSEAYPNKTEDDFIGVVMRDRVKKRLCEENGVWLLIIPYTVGTGNIRKFILDHLPETHQ